MTNSNFDTETPGALIGKFVRYDGEKYLVYGDVRLIIPEHAYPFKLCREQDNYFVTAYVSNISEWVEPKKKKLIAPYIYRSCLVANKFTLSDYLHTKKEAEKQIGFISWCAQLAIEVDDE